MREMPVFRRNRKCIDKMSSASCTICDPACAIIVVNYAFRNGG